VAPNLTKTFLASGASGAFALMGCELVAGIQDITLAVVRDGGPADATMADRDSGAAGDVASRGEPAETDVAALPDGRETGWGGPVDASVAADSGEVDSSAAMRDASFDADVVQGGSPGNASDGESEASHHSVLLVGLDGGPIYGPDGGPLLGELIDDIDSETTPGWILARSMRVGTWFTYDDGTAGGIVPAPGTPSAIVMSGLAPPGGPTQHGAHAQGSGLAMYAGMGFNLNAYSNVVSTYDASRYQGVLFWARVGGDSGTATVKFAIPDRNTASAGGVCTLTDGSTSGCGDYFATPPLTVTASWQEYVVSFDRLGRSGWGTPMSLAGLDAANVYSCQWQLTSGPAFDLWIESVYFIDK
jgi:hypothetical protein